MSGGIQLFTSKCNYLMCSLELCLTSNVKGRITPSFDAHHFRIWYELGHPIVICVSVTYIHIVDTRYLNICDILLTFTVNVNIYAIFFTYTAHVNMHMVY